MTTIPSPPLRQCQLQELADNIDLWAKELGFQQSSILIPDLSTEHPLLEQWLERGYHGDMQYLANNLDLRREPLKLVPGSCRIISVRMDYQPPATDSIKVLRDKDKAYIARYTLGRDYHKTLRKRLTTLGKRIQQHSSALGYRAFVDSAPIMERAIAEQAGLGWSGKHTLLINREAGSYFFLAELFIDLPLPTTEKRLKNHCGKCTACLDICPTNAFVDANILDARRCISYLTIESKDAIPLELRAMLGNRIFGCDDCQLICPWNKFAKFSPEDDFKPRHNLDDISLLELFNWDEKTFLKKTEGSAIRRTGFDGWQRNIAVALGNSHGGAEVEAALSAKLSSCSPLVAEHISWALQQLEHKSQRRTEDCQIVRIIGAKS
ncbi:MAG: tRNA epoxyqueuosine(34) reductase QueG [Pseudomonadales bacterium]|nr:tRNA epoxyqueuosine(34) reductase QueG [Pseudomonadales bacterium]